MLRDSAKKNKKGRDDSESGIKGVKPSKKERKLVSRYKCDIKHLRAWELRQGTAAPGCGVRKFDIDPRRPTDQSSRASSLTFWTLTDPGIVSPLAISAR